MDRSRTPLGKWFAAIELLSSTSGVNAKQLAAGIGVSHKTAWLMLRKFRCAIGEVESGRKLYGTVHAGLQALAPRYLFLFLPEERFRKERVVFVGGSVGPSGEPTSLRIGLVPSRHLVPGTKVLSGEGQADCSSAIADRKANLAWLNPVRMYQSPLNQCFKEAKGWMNWLFNGIGTKYLQSYLDEFCFRWNTAAGGMSPREAWSDLCYAASRNAGKVHDRRTA